MAKIIGLGEWFPEKVRRNEDWSDELVATFKAHLQRELLDVMSEDTSGMDAYSLAGFSAEMDDPFVGSIERRVVEDEITSADAETFAAKMAIQDAKIDPKEIRIIYSWAVIPDLVNLTCAALIGKNLGMTEFCGFGVEGACVSAIGQLMMAKALVDSKQAKYVLLTQSHLMTKALPMTHPASPNIGDAATAILVGPDDHEGHLILGNYARSHGEYYNCVAWKRREGDQSWLAGGGPYFLGSFDRENAKTLVQNTVRFGATTVTAALAEFGMTPNDIDVFISVNPRKWIPAGIAGMMCVSADKTLQTFEQYAHLGGCGAVVNLIEARKRGMMKPGNIVAMYAQGSGFTRGTTTIKW